MSTPVDGLAVLDDHMRVHGRNGCPQHQRELLVVRNAFAGLIEADRRVAERARRKAGGGWWMISNEDMSALRAALARVQGGAA